MSSGQVFSYYPKYQYLDNLISLSKRKRMKLYIDVKGCATAVFQQWVVQTILAQSKGSSIVDTSLFNGILEFIAYHKLYSKKRNIPIEMYFFMETGNSSYHVGIYPDYKAHRKDVDFFGLGEVEREYYLSILRKNYVVAEKVVNKIPDCYFIKLDYLEADFMPYYLMKYELDKNDVDSSINVIYSLDKDMYQCLDSANIYQFFRHYKNVKMLNQDNFMSSWFKLENYNVGNAAEWFPMVLAILGDDCDGVPGIKGIGGVTFREMFEELKTICNYSMTSVYDNIKLDKSIFNREVKTESKAIKKILDNEASIVRNLKLVSYKLLIDSMLGGYPVDMITKKNQIHECVSNKDKWKNSVVLNEALNRSGLLGSINDITLNNLFIN